jgi:histidinol dehydrogenase
MGLIKIIKADGKCEVDLLYSIRKRNEETNSEVTSIVNQIISDVKLYGDKAVKEYTLKFDKVDCENFEVTQAEIDSAICECDDVLIKALNEAAQSIKEFHINQKQKSWEISKNDGIRLGQQIRGLNRVGLYVPGGTASYPSSVLMNAIPAKVAGVNELIMVTPPSKNGKINPVILAAAKIAGVDKIYGIGGAQAVAALAYGTETIPSVDKIVGPGNIFVATAKRQVFGTVDIDMIAGPSEILIIADEFADPEYVAADLMSQAEHDVLASSILITTSMQVAEQTLIELENQMKNLDRKEIIEKSIRSYGVIIVIENIDKAIEIANEIAPEHLELMIQNPMDYLEKVKNAGSIFLGKYSPEPLGDYFAGPNHVLPTSGTARFFSPLSVDSFIKKSSFIYYTREALRKAKDTITTIAESEGLTAHSNSINVRFK